MATMSARSEIVSKLIRTCHPTGPVRIGRLDPLGIPVDCVLSLRMHGRRAAQARPARLLRQAWRECRGLPPWITSTLPAG